MSWQPGRVLLQGLFLLVFTFHWFALATLPSNAKFYTIHWNSSNPIFRIDNTDNIIDVNRNNVKFEYDQVNLICPVYTPGTRDDEMEKYIIYNVSKDEYETCRITNPNPRIIAVCDKPYKLIQVGHDYYFISTSTSDDLHRRIGGRCTTHNMKIVFKVWGAPPTVAPPPPPPAPTAKPSWWAVAPTRTSPWTTQGPPPTLAPPPPTTKKSKTYDKHPNEVVKSEELTLAAGGLCANAVLVASLCACAVWMLR
ncbi:unnamed protein product [Phaedon cochleariae]|uniref:Ephrin RBD domain-containing protein n=1 Tax=Phaedon cochleariae TaxID=80249 RepID=A0A9N9SDU0_PHACE|nr:unnamed protein product [Phaedon cochleariae]